MVVVVEQQDGSGAHSAITVGEQIACHRGRPGASCQDGVPDEEVTVAAVMKQAGHNDGSGCVRATSCRTMAPSQAPGRRRRTTDPFHLSPNHDPSRAQLGHGNGDFSRHAWRDRAGMPDSGGELLFACRAGLLAHRLPCSKSGLGRTADRQSPDNGSERRETSGTIRRRRMRRCKSEARHSGVRCLGASAI
jgi:hypothetical protein